MPNPLKPTDPTDRTAGEVDILDDIFQELRLRGSIFFNSDLGPEWGYAMSTSHGPRFHMMLKGECFVGSDAFATICVKPGDIVMIPNGHAHWIASSVEADRMLVEYCGRAFGEELPDEQPDEVRNRLSCGTVNYDQCASHPIFSSLPDVIHFTSIEATDPLHALATVIDSELRHRGAFRGHVIDRLTEILFCQLIYRHKEHSGGLVAAVPATIDRRIYTALLAIHQRPEKKWTLDELGEKVGMSRATLVRHFHDAIGMAPIAYISHWKMIKAYNQLVHSNHSVEHIAQSLGYESKEALTKVFSKQHGRSPAELRLSKS